MVYSFCTVSALLKSVPACKSFVNKIYMYCVNLSVFFSFGDCVVLVVLNTKPYFFKFYYVILSVISHLKEIIYIFMEIPAFYMTLLIASLPHNFVVLTAMFSTLVSFIENLSNVTVGVIISEGWKNGYHTHHL